MTERPGNQFPNIPGYRIESILGSGSMATVYRARQQGMERPVAVKVLSEAVVENPKILKRLMREARIAARFNHPHLVRALDAGVHEGSCYFVMELVDGFSIREIVEREGPFSEERAIEIAVELAEALNELHHSHVVHRDVKPANVIIDSDGRALLADLGLAKMEYDSSMTSQHRTVGTPAYMSPEQVKDPDHVDSRSDLFSLGVTLFYIFTGTSPFAGTSVSSVLTKILYEEAPSLQSVAPEVSDAMDAIVARLLEKDRTRRYASPAALLRDLRALHRGADLPLGRLAPARPKRRQQYLYAGLAAALVIPLLIFLWPKTDDPEPVDPSITGKESAQVPAQPVLDEAELESDLVRVLRGIELAVKTGLDGGNIERVRSALKTDWREQFEAGMGGKLETLPRIAQLRWENATLEYERLILAKAKELERIELQQLQFLYEQETERLQNSATFLAEATILERLAALPLPATLSSHESSSLALVRRNAVDKLLAQWRLEIDRELEKARANLAAADLDSTRALLARLQERQPELVSTTAVAAIEALRKQMEQGEAETSRRVENALALIDVLPPLGFPQLADRDFAPVLDRIEPVLKSLSGEEVTDEAALLGVMAEVLRDVADLPQRLVAALRSERIPKSRELRLRSGKTFKVGHVIEIQDEVLKYQGPVALPVEVALRDLSATTLIDLVGVTDPVRRARSAIFLHYCDGDLLAAELLLAEFPADTAFRQFMTKRLATSWVDVAHVRTAEDKEAFRIWTETLVAFREGEIATAAVIAKPLRSDGALKKSEWYREQRLEIHRVLDEIELRLAVAGSFGPNSKNWQLVKKDPPVVRAAWDFDLETEALDFMLPADHGFSDGKIGRLAPAAGEDLRPDRLLPIRLGVDVDLESEVFELNFDLRTSNRSEEAPRFFILSIGGHHIGILSRLRQTASFRHLQLHGAERLVADFMVLGRLAQWDGKLSDYRQAFSSSLYQQPLVLNVGQLYHFQLRIDPKDKTMHLRIDDVEVLDRKLNQLNLAETGIEWRAAMPFSLTSVTLEAALRLK